MTPRMSVGILVWRPLLQCIIATRTPVEPPTGVGPPTPAPPGPGPAGPSLRSRPYAERGPIARTIPPGPHRVKGHGCRSRPRAPRPLGSASPSLLRGGGGGTVTPRLDPRGSALVPLGQPLGSRLVWPQVRAGLPRHLTSLRTRPSGQGRMGRGLQAAPEAVGPAVGGGCQSGWGRLLSVTNAVEAGTWRPGDSGWAWAGRPGGGHQMVGQRNWMSPP